MPRNFLLVALVLALCGCARMQDQPGADVLAEERTDVVFATTECTVKGENGTCNVKTCKTDDKSNCQQFAGACLDTGHHYSGTAEGGT